MSVFCLSVCTYSKNRSTVFKKCSIQELNVVPDNDEARKIGNFLAQIRVKTNILNKEKIS